MSDTLKGVLAGALFLALLQVATAAAPSSSDESGILQLLIDKAREREALFDGVDARYSYEWSVVDEEATPYIPEGQLPTDELALQQMRRQETFARSMDRRLAGSGASVQWIKSGEKYLFESQPYHPQPPSHMPESLVYVCDGHVTRGLITHSGWELGTVSPGGTTRNPASTPTPDGFAVVSLPRYTDNLWEILSGKPKIHYVSRDDPVEGPREVRVVGEETLDGREVVVVEIAEPFEGRPTWCDRIYFDRDLEYACVRYERGRLQEDGFSAGIRWDFGDFREVKPGLYVPFEAAHRDVTPPPHQMSVLTCRVEELTFPSHIADSTFVLDFPAGTTIVDELVHLRLNATETPRDILEGLEFPVETDGAVSAAPQPAVVVEPPPSAVAEAAVEENRQSGPLLVSILLAVVLLALVLTFALVRRRAQKEAL